MKIDFTYRLPTLEDQDAIMEYVDEFHASGEKFVHASSGVANMNYVDWVEKVNNATIKPREGCGRSNLYMVMFNDIFIGLIYIRYEMPEDRRYVYGDIGYSVRPSARHMGFATEMLRIGLNELRGHGRDHAILVCDKSNIASTKTMINNGGRLIKEFHNEDGELEQIYQFTLL